MDPGSAAPAPGRLATASLSLLTLAGGAALAVVPAAVLSVSAHVYDTEQQAWVAVAVTASAFIAAVVSAAVVESRLASPATRRAVQLPRWLAIVGLVGALLLAAFPLEPIAMCVALPMALAAVETGRAAAVAERDDVREIIAAVLLGAGAAVGVVAAILGAWWGMVPIGLGVAAATVVRVAQARRPVDPPDLAARRWVVTDVASTGIVYPLLNAAVLALVGPQQAVVFAAVSTVTGLVAIPVNYLRMRLLKAHSTGEVWLSSVTILVAVAVVVVLDLTGVLALLFGAAWADSATILVLVVACAWRVAGIVSTLPSTALRRAGRAGLLTGLRAACTAAIFLAGTLLALTGSVAAVFAALLAGEFLQFGVYEAARRRTSSSRPSTESDSLD